MLREMVPEGLDVLEFQQIFQLRQAGQECGPSDLQGPSRILANAKWLPSLRRRRQTWCYSTEEGHGKSPENVACQPEFAPIRATAAAGARNLRQRGTTLAIERASSFRASNRPPSR